MENFRGGYNSNMNPQYTGNGYPGYSNEQENLYPGMQPMTSNVNPGFSMNQDQNTNYYQEYCKLFVANVVLTNQIKELIAEKNGLVERVARLEAGGGSTERQTPQPKRKDEATPVTKQSSTVEEDKKKRSRRTASEIEKHFQCPVTNCQKGYGSEGALLQHARLKHPELLDEIKSQIPKTAQS